MTLCSDCGRELPEAGGTSCDEVLALLAGPQPTTELEPGHVVVRVGAYWLTGPAEHATAIAEMNPPCAALREREETQRRAALPPASPEELEHLHAEALRRARELNPGAEIIDLGPGGGILSIPASFDSMMTLGRIAEALDLDDGCYGSEGEPAQDFESLAELDRHMDAGGYAFNALNEVLGCRLLDDDGAGGRFCLYVTVVMPRHGSVEDWTCMVELGQEAELLAFLAKCRRRALDRTALLWPDLSLNSQ